MNEWLITEKLKCKSLNSLLTSEVTGGFKTGEIEGCGYSLSCDLSNAVHRIHESKFDFLILVESILTTEINKWNKGNRKQSVNFDSLVFNQIDTVNYLEEILRFLGKSLLMLVGSILHSTLKVGEQRPQHLVTVLDVTLQ